MESAGLYLGAIYVDEFITTLTDIMVAVICFYAGSKLKKIDSDRKQRSLLVWYFITMGLATLTGGVLGHGFLYALSWSWKLPGWLFSIISVYLIAGFQVNYSRSMLGEKMYRNYRLANTLVFGVFTLLTIVFQKFAFVEAHTAYGFLGVVGYLGFVHLKREGKHHPLRFFLIAIGISFVAGVVFLAQIGFGKWFNHLDLSHVFLGLSAWYFYLGAKRLLSEKGPIH